MAPRRSGRPVHGAWATAWRAAAVAALGVSAGALTFDGSSTAATTGQARRIGQAPPAALGVVRLGALPGATHVSVDVELRPRSAAALARYATAVATPGSRAFRRYLGPGQFASEFGPSARALSAVTGWLSSEGLTVESISANHLTVHVTSTAAALDRAWSVGLVRYRLEGDRTAFANTRAPLVSGPAARVVQGVVGLDELVRPRWIGGRGAAALGASPKARRPGAGPQPCSAAAAAASHLHAYTATQLAAAYGLSSLYAAGDEGAGITIAMFEQETNLTSDVAAYQSCFGTASSVSYVKVDGGSGPPTDGEADEDIEVAVGLAPKAHLDVFQAPGTLKGTLDDYTAIVDRDTAQVISTSWGQCESQTGSALLAAENTVFEQAAVQGQTMLSASGDSGSSGCSTKALDDDDPPSQPYVTGVGGTKLTAVGPPPTEIAWNESATSTGASGGGISAAHRMPSYQSGAASALHVVSQYSSGTPCGAPAGSYCREVPDVSADADYATGYLVFYNGRWESNGGTSAAAPLWAALFALTDASKSCGGKDVGFANPALYEAAATAYSADFHDVTIGTNDDTQWGNRSGLYPAGVGYDMATGLGTPNGANLATSLCADAHVTVEPSVTGLAVGKASVASGAEQAETFTVRVTGRRRDGRPVGSVVVFNVAKRLCSHAVTAVSSVQSLGRCSLTATELRAGRHPDVYAVFDPNVGSSSNTRYHYRSSRSKKRLLVVTSG